jgi:hypothetical protein
MLKYQLDPEEQDLLDSYERGEWQSVPFLDQEMQRYQQAAQAQFSTPLLYRFTKRLTLMIFIFAPLRKFLFVSSI